MAAEQGTQNHPNELLLPLTVSKYSSESGCSAVKGTPSPLYAVRSVSHFSCSATGGELDAAGEKSGGEHGLPFKDFEGEACADLGISSNISDLFF